MNGHCCHFTTTNTKKAVRMRTSDGGTEEWPLKIGNPLQVGGHLMSTPVNVIKRGVLTSELVWREKQWSGAGYQERISCLEIRA